VIVAQATDKRALRIALVGSEVWDAARDTPVKSYLAELSTNGVRVDSEVPGGVSVPLKMVKRPRCTGAASRFLTDW
jgi:hypothetical protein